MRAILSISLLVAGPALATCPTADDLIEGVVLVQNEPLFVRSDVELRATGFVEARVTGEPGGEKTGEVRTFDHALALTQDASDGVRTFYSYDPDVTRLDRLDQTGEARFTVTGRSEFGKDFTAELLFTLDGQGTMQIMSCTYDTWTVREMRAAPDGTLTTRTLTYSPELRLVLAADGDTAADTFAYTWIGTAADVAR